jgi:hypothetical protein
MGHLERNQYVRQVLALYQATPGTRGRIRPADRRLAEQLHANGTTTDTVRNALLLAAARRNYRPNDAEPLQPIASLHYFVPVIHEVQKNPPDPGYVQYLEAKLADYQDGFRRPPNHRSS